MSCVLSPVMWVVTLTIVTLLINPLKSSLQPPGRTLKALNPKPLEGSLKGALKPKGPDVLITDAGYFPKS